jgi:TRAP-type C4-dicarboxylate transport system permease small subunit
MRTAFLYLMLPFALAFAYVSNMAKTRPLGGWTRKNPRMALAIIFCALLFFFLTDILHLFKPP